MDASTKETQAQILQMTQFILNEARDKAEEIDTKALQEESIERLKIVNSMKEKIQQEYARKTKQIETQAAIARSTAINRSRLEKIKSRQEMLTKLSEESQAQLVEKLKAQATHKQFITKLIVQGLLMLLEDHVEVRCRKCDEALVAECLDGAVKEYTEVIKKSTGATKTCKVSLDKAVQLPPAPGGGQHGPTCLGGVVLACQKGSITIDNTIDSRLELVMEQAKPTIRKLLFTK
ncbi:VATE [Symbiodinium sp. CCMP2592]|nr:VATE [Symbiodinium sp. CCMP2592]